MSRFWPSLLTLTLLVFVLNLTADGQGAKSKTWPLQTKGQEGLREPQERATLPAPAAAFSKPATRPAEPEGPALARRGAGEWALARGWRMAEAPKVSGEGDAVSRPGYSADGWLRATVPGTVLTTLVDRGVYPDPDYGLNNLAIPETLNRQDYWYRTEFTPHASTKGRRFQLTLNGVNYSAAVWLNGRRLGEVRGAFLRAVFDVTDVLLHGRTNALAVRVGDVQVITRLPLPDTTRAAVNLHVPLVNETEGAVNGVLEASFEGVTV